MSAVRSKICGITRVEDALAAVAAGADAIGLVFYAPSLRAVSLQRAQEILLALPPFVSTVGLFVDAARGEVEALLEVLPLDLLQFHGDETPADCEGFGRPYMKALRVRPGLDLHAQARLYAGAQALLLDTFVPGVPGGTGEAFDWDLVPHDLAKPVVLAGGLTPENVGEAIRRVRPFAVDVSGGVEQARGIKDAAMIEAFIRAVRHA